MLLYACILCDSSSVFPLELKNNRRFLHCKDCDLIFVPEDFHPSPVDEITRYRLHDNSLLNEGYVRMFKEKISLIHQYCPGSHSVLDYGCGTEPVLAELMKRDGFECDVYDLYFFPALPEKTYDIIISTEVFEHFRDIKTELLNIRSLMATQGFLAIMTSFHDSAGNLEDWWYMSDITHICFFSMRTFEWIANRFGLRTIYTNRKNFIIFQAE